MGLTSSALIALVLIALVLLAAARDRMQLGTNIGRGVARGSVTVAALLAGFVAISVGFVRTPLAVVDLDAGESADLPVLESSSAMLVSGLLPPVSSGKDAAGSFLLGLYDGTTPVAHFKGQLEEHWISGRAGRRGSTTTLVSHLEQRILLPDSVLGRPLKLKLDSESGQLHGPLRVEVIHAPPARSWVLGLGAAVAVAGAFSDAVDRRRTHNAVWTGVLAAFAGFLLDGITPHGPARAVVGAAFAALVIGTVGGMFLRSMLFGMVRPRVETS